jgi:hypothetical protein
MFQSARLSVGIYVHQSSFRIAINSFEAASQHHRSKVQQRKSETSTGCWFIEIPSCCFLIQILHLISLFSKFWSYNRSKMVHQSRRALYTLPSVHNPNLERATTSLLKQAVHSCIIPI